MLKRCFEDQTGKFEAQNWCKLLWHDWKLNQPTGERDKESIIAEEK